MLVETVTETRVVVDWASVAAELEPMVMDRMRDSYDHWDDIGMRAMVVADAADGLRVCEMLATGSSKGVNEYLWNMDTAPREEIVMMIESITGSAAAVNQLYYL